MRTNNEQRPCHGTGTGIACDSGWCSRTAPQTVSGDAAPYDGEIGVLGTRSSDIDELLHVGYGQRTAVRMRLVSIPHEAMKSRDGRVLARHSDGREEDRDARDMRSCNLPIPRGDARGIATGYPCETV